MVVEEVESPPLSRDGRQMDAIRRQWDKMIPVGSVIDWSCHPKRTMAANAISCRSSEKQERRKTICRLSRFFRPAAFFRLIRTAMQDRPMTTFLTSRNDEVLINQAVVRSFARFFFISVVTRLRLTGSLGFFFYGRPFFWVSDDSTTDWLASTQNFVCAQRPETSCLMAPATRIK